MEDAARSQQSFELVPVDGEPLSPFKPGQYVTVQLPQAPESSAPLIRCYSLSDSPSTTHYRITVKRVQAPLHAPHLPPGMGSGALHDQVKEGDVLPLRAPSGDFYLDPSNTRDIVLIAGGIGITPLMCMLAWLSEHQPERKVHLYYGVRNGSEQVFGEVLSALAQRHPAWQIKRVFSCPQSHEIAGKHFDHQGRVEIGLLKQTLPAQLHDFYLCGPGPMMASLVPALLEWGVPNEHIHFEAFGPASTLRPVTPKPSATTALPASLQVKLTQSERTLHWQPGQYTSLLDLLQAHHVQVNAGCRMGACGACETGVISGSVQYEETPSFGIPQGACLLCSAQPTSDLVLNV